jgi:hypothetical protein
MVSRHADDPSDVDCAYKLWKQLKLGGRLSAAPSKISGLRDRRRI